MRNTLRHFLGQTPHSVHSGSTCLCTGSCVLGVEERSWRNDWTPMISPESGDREANRNELPCQGRATNVEPPSEDVGPWEAKHRLCHLLGRTQLPRSVGTGGRRLPVCFRPDLISVPFLEWLPFLNIQQGLTGPLPWNWTCPSRDE